MDLEHFHDFVKSKKKPSSSVEVQNSLRKEIMQLEKRLQDQVAVRGALEKALGYGSSSHKTTAETPITKPTRELIREIAVLEVEVGHLEQYLLSLYRQAFDQQRTSLSPPRRDDRLKPHASGTPRRRLNFSKSDALFRTEASNLPVKESNGFADIATKSDFRVQRSHSSLSQRSGLPNRTLTPEDTLGKSVRACHSQPLSTREYAQNASSNMFSLGEHVFNHITTDHVPETPNKLSEEMIKCMSTIYCKLADPPLITSQLGASSPTTSAFSSPNPYSHDGLWSPEFRNVSSFDVRLDNPFHVEGLKDFSGPYSTMIEIQCIYRDNHKLCEIEPLLQYYRSLICQLDETDPSSLKSHEEKLAFWINIHNALVMHAYLAYGIPQSSMKKVFLLLKAAYNVGGCIISADAIQTSILKCRMSRPGQWIRVLLSSKAKFRTEDKRQAFVIEHPEPLLHFALSSGNHSDPAVRLYTPKRVFRELEAAKEEYTRATFGVTKDNKILLPKVVESFAKDSGMSSAGVVEMVWQSLPDSLRKKSISMTKKKFQLRKGRKNIEWVPHNFAFRYLIFKELVR